MYSFYINLDRRTDRRAEFEAELARMGLKSERFSAIEKITGGLGCCCSHLEVLKLARERNYPEVMIFEDDFVFLISPDHFNSIVSSFPEDYDVVMLDRYILQKEEYNETFDRILEAQSAAGYVVHSRFYDQIISNLEDAVRLYEQNPECHWLYINDQYWKHLQPISRWYCSRVQVGRQRPGFSDLKERVLENIY